LGPSSLKSWERFGSIENVDRFSVGGLIEEDAWVVWLVSEALEVVIELWIQMQEGDLNFFYLFIFIFYFYFFFSVDSSPRSHLLSFLFSLQLFFLLLCSTHPNPGGTRSSVGGGWS